MERIRFKSCLSYYTDLFFYIFSHVQLNKEIFRWCMYSSTFPVCFSAGPIEKDTWHKTLQFEKCLLTLFHCLHMILSFEIWLYLYGVYFHTPFLESSVCPMPPLKIRWNRSSKVGNQSWTATTSRFMSDMLGIQQHVSEIRLCVLS